MLQVEEAISILTDRISPVTETENADIAESLGRVLAEDVRAQYDNPPFDRSPLDGYALKGEDTLAADRDNPVVLKVTGKVFAGSVFEGEISSGEAVRIMTGAPVPRGADAVIMQEDTDYGETNVSIYRGVKPYSNYCYKGEDYKAGEILLKQGMVINAGIVSVLASMGITSVCVYKKPGISVMVTGDEVIEPGRELLPGKIYDSNLTYITTRLKELSLPAQYGVHVPDDAEKMADIIRERAGKDQLIITTGGVSVGQKDIMHDVAKLLDAEVLFWKVRIKPGAPTLAFFYGGALVVCLSGNPYGAIANFEILVRPVLAKLTGDPGKVMKKQAAVLMNEFVKGPGSRRYLRGFLDEGQVWINGRNQSSGALSAMTMVNCLVEIMPDMAGAVPGNTVDVFVI